MIEDRDWQRLDKWLWCARFMKARSDCARLVSGGLLRINRQPTDKPHARVRVGDVLTVPMPRAVIVLRVAALAARRGPAPEARTLYDEITSDLGARPCNTSQTAAYAQSLPPDLQPTRSQR